MAGIPLHFSLQAQLCGEGRDFITASRALLHFVEEALLRVVALVVLLNTIREREVANPN